MFKGTPSRFAEVQPNATRVESSNSTSALPVSPGRTRGTLLQGDERRQRAESAGVLEGNADVATRVRAAIFGGVGGGLSRTQSDQVIARAGYGRPSDERLNSTIDGPQHMQKRESTDIGARLRAAVFGSEPKRVSTANDAGPSAKRPSSRERGAEGFRGLGPEEWGAHRRRSSGGEYGTAQETAAALEASWMNGFLSPPRAAGKSCLAISRHCLFLGKLFESRFHLLLRRKQPLIIETRNRRAFETKIWGCENQQVRPAQFKGPGFSYFFVASYTAYDASCSTRKVTYRAKKDARQRSMKRAFKKKATLELHFGATKAHLNRRAFATLSSLPH